VLRAVWEPWVAQPQMLAAFWQAHRGPGGKQLQEGLNVTMPVIHSALAGADADQLADFDLVLLHVLGSVIDAFTNGDLLVTDVIPTLERTVYRLLADNRIAGVGPEPAAAAPPRPLPTGRRQQRRRRDR
ncbi:MAG: hypothetical protein ABR549_11445, partial [Mycobacteriales bacterium]